MSIIGRIEELEKKLAEMEKAVEKIQEKLAEIEENEDNNNIVDFAPIILELVKVIEDELGVDLHKAKKAMGMDKPADRMKKRKENLIT